jgi:chaperonin GroEL
LISEELGLKLDTAGVEVMGSAKKVIISKDDTLILDGSGEKASLEDRVSTIRQ